MNDDNMTRLRPAVLAAALLAPVAPVFAGGLGDPGASAPAPEVDQLIVRFATYQGSEAEQGIAASQLRRIERAAGVELHRVRTMALDARVLGLPAAMPQAAVEAIAARIAALPGVEFAVPDQIMQPMLVPNDARYSEQWHYYEAVGGIEMPAAWDITTGSSSVHVAVIDTGIRGDHEDLSGRWAGGYDFISGRFNANDGDGRDADPTDPGDAFLFNSSSWHGTHVSGTIGAASNNGIGVAGINWQSIIQPVRVLGRIGGTTSDIVDGMLWAAGLTVPNVPDNPNPAAVLNMSLGGSGACNTVWQDAVDQIVAAGSVVVVAAGNSASDAAGFSPASCDDVITVAATARDGDLAFYSNYGDKVEISAPGGETAIPGNGVLSTLDSGNRRPAGDDYVYYQGTSMASPHVAGVVSLLKSVDPSLTPAEILTALQSTAKAFPSGSQCDNTPGLCGAGIVDAHAALMHVLP